MKTYLQNLPSKIGVFVVSLFLGAMCSFSGSAAVLDLGQMELDHPYDVEGDGTYLFGQVKGEYTAPKAMSVCVEFSPAGYYMGAYKDADHTEGFKTEWVGNHYVIDLAAGQTAYFYEGFLMNNFTVTLSDDSNRETNVLSVYPDPETNPNLSIGITASVEFQFSSTVTCGSAELICGNNTANVVPTVLNGGIYVRVPVKPTLLSWYNENAIAAGKTLTVKLHDVMANGKLVNGNGVVSVSYTTMSCPAQILWTENLPPEQKYFYSYYMNNDPNSIVKIHFSAPILPPSSSSSDLVVRLQIGDIETEAYSEDLYPAVMDENTLVISFQGVRRSYSDMFPNLSSAALSGSEYKYMNLLIMGLKGTDGQYTITDGDANIGSYGYQYTFVDVSSTVVTDITPAQGSTVDAGQEVEIYIRGFESMSFSGINVKYRGEMGDETVFVPYRALEIAQDPEDDQATLINFYIPEMQGAVPGSDITISFADLTFADGYEHNINFRYKVGTPLSVSGLGSYDASFSTVYGADGTIVKRNASAEDINALSSGLYIVNGKKIVKK